MLCAIYKSSVKEETYLYLPKKDDFSSVPEALLDTFGKPIFVIMLNLAKRETLAQADLPKVKQKLIDDGYYLQIPPPKENLLKQHLENNQQQKAGK
ncbi:YcgL domain-containing protein [Flocculibacter collagenilyticus]|uniref:YcgL domain-containing protein n=1 Tax=Flocculibacter collagenilyticus TaxID=2744479 RepID=UPI0018F436F2|nr:YcgL domain-containing protein [Flocculibacter collagenilyticus]